MKKPARILLRIINVPMDFMDKVFSGYAFYYVYPSFEDLTKTIGTELFMYTPIFKNWQ